MQAVIKIKPSELTNELVDNIKRMVGEKQNVEITINVTDKEPKAYLLKKQGKNTSKIFEKPLTMWKTSEILFLLPSKNLKNTLNLYLKHERHYI